MSAKTYVQITIGGHTYPLSSLSWDSAEQRPRRPVQRYAGIYTFSAELELDAACVRSWFGALEQMTADAEAISRWESEGGR